MTVLLIFSLLLNRAQALDVQSAQEVLEKVYQTHQHTGIAVPNHESDQSIRLLNKFLTSQSDDLDLGYVLVEGPAELQDIFQKASLGELDQKSVKNELGEYWRDHFANSIEWQTILSETLPLIQKINVSRPQRPLILLPIDGASQAMNQRDVAMIQEGKWSGLYLTSINREMDTSENFRQIMQAQPHLKTLVYYHQAHILKGLQAQGEYLNESLDVQGQLPGPLGWVGYVRMVVPEFYNQFGVILINQTDPRMNPDGVLKKSSLPAVNSGQGFLLPDDKALLSSDWILPKSFLDRYRGGTVTFPHQFNSVCEAVIQL